jgi:hypothetical protein
MVHLLADELYEGAEAACQALQCTCRVQADIAARCRAALQVSWDAGTRRAAQLVARTSDPLKQMDHLTSGRVPRLPTKIQHREKHHDQKFLCERHMPLCVQSRAAGATTRS